MDPNIMKFLEEDEDETMHSGADVEAFTAQLNRDMEGNDSTPHQLSDSSAALSQGNSQTTSQYLSQWQTQTPTQDGIANFQSGKDIVAIGNKDQHSSELELQRQDSDPQNRKEDSSSHEPNPLLPNTSTVASSQLHDDRNTFPVPQPVGGQQSGEQPVSVQVLDHDSKPDKELQINKLQNFDHHSSSSDKEPMEFNDQQILPTGKGSQPTSVGSTNDQVMSSMNSHTTGMEMTSQLTSGTSTMTSTTQPSATTMKLNKQVPFGMLLPIIQPQLDKDRAMQLHTLYFKLKKNEISKDGFVRHMRSIVGDQMLKMAVYKLQTQAARNPQTATNQFQSQPQGSGRPQVPAQLPVDLSNSVSENIAAKSRELDKQVESHGAQVGVMSISNSSALTHERKHPAIPTQGLNKQHMKFPQASFPTYGSSGGGYPSFPVTSAASSAAIRTQAPSHPNQSINHLGPASRPLNLSNMTTSRPTGSLTHMNSNTAPQQNRGQWPSSMSKEQKTSMSPSINHVKQEPSDQSNEQQKAQFSTSHGLSSMPPAPSNLDESFEMQLSRTGLAIPANLVPSNPSLMEASSRMPSLTSSIGAGNSSKAPLKKPLIGQKKPMEAPGSSPPSSKKQKVSGSFVDQSIEHLNDVTAVSGVNLREEEEQLFSGPKEDSRVSEASRRVVQEEEERLILQKVPLQKVVMEIVAKSGLKNMSKDVERCLSLCVEERMHGLISNCIRLSKQRVDAEKPRHKTIITSDVRQQIMTINRKAREEWEKKQVETEKSQKVDEPESSTGIDADKDKDDRGKSTRVNKEEDDKMRTTAANVAVRAATGVGDITSRWQLMIEAKQKQEGSDTPSAPQTNKDVGRKPATSKRNTRENQDSEKMDSSFTRTTPASVRKVGRNQVVVPRVDRSVAVKDVVAALEREPQMLKSTLLYRLYQKVGGADTVEE